MHDNDGTADQHTLNEFGTIDWDNLAKKLSKRKNVLEDISLDYEISNKSIAVHNDCEECLKKVKRQADELEEKILKYLAK